MRIAVVMVGLPATGKTFTARNLARYLRWMGVRTRTFHAAAYRRALVGADVWASFFDATDAALLALRTRVADAVLADMLAWLCDDAPNGPAPDGVAGECSAARPASVSAYDEHRVAVLDAANTRPERRAVVLEACARHGVQVLFVECTYTAARRLVPVAARELRLAAPEYAGMDARAALADYVRRIAHYAPHYVPLAADGALAAAMRVTLVDGGVRVVAAHVHGFLPSRVLFFLMHARTEARRVMLAALPCAAEALGAHARRLHRTLCVPVQETRRAATSDGESVLSVHLEDVSSAVFPESQSPSLSERHSIGGACTHPSTLHPCGECGSSNETCTHLSKLQPCGECGSADEDARRAAAYTPFAVWTETSGACDVLRDVFGPGHALQSKPQLRALDSALARTGAAESDPASVVGADEWAAFVARPMTHRVFVPGAELAESYRDLALRLENAIIELEASAADVLVVAHPSVLRVIYAYFVSGDDCVLAGDCGRLGAHGAALASVSPRAGAAGVRDALLATEAPASTQSSPGVGAGFTHVARDRTAIAHSPAGDTHGDSVGAAILRMHPFPADTVVVLETRPYGVVERHVPLPPL